LTQAQDYLELASDPEALTWLQSVKVVAWRLYSDSIWKTAQGLYPRMNELLSALMAAGREHPLLPLAGGRFRIVGLVRPLRRPCERRRGWAVGRAL
jgi:hypothetical protein